MIGVCNIKVWEGMAVMKTYLRHRIINVIDIKELIALEYLDLCGKYKDYSEAHDFWELCYVKNGGFVLNIDSNEIAVRAGEMAIVSPDRKHSYISNDIENSCAFVICFKSPSQSLKALADGSFDLDLTQKNCLDIIIEESQKTFFMNEKDQLEVLPSPNFGGEQAISSLLEYLLICTLRKISAKENAEVVFLDDNDFYADLVDVIIRYFEKNISKRMTLDQICNKMNYSRSFLCRTFKQQTGESLISRFNKMKIERAKHLLKSTNMPIVRIAYELGFSDAKYFNTTFKKCTGVAPGSYRKEKLTAEKKRN